MSDTFDIIIIGGGAAGTAAAITALNRGKTVAVIANPVETTALFKAERVTNYPGFDEITGAALAERFRAQLDASAAELIPGRALSVTPLGDSFGVAVGNEFYMASAVILAVGITRASTYPGEERLLGRGVSYCATCDGMLYRGKTVAVIGSTREAHEDADFLESIGCSVLRFADARRYEIRGEERVEALVADATEYSVDAVFIIKESIKLTRLVPGLDTAPAGIVTAFGGATNIPGVFAAGDCAGKPYQLPKATGEGNVAALAACEYLAAKKSI